MCASSPGGRLVRDNSKLLVLLVVPLSMAAMFGLAEIRPGYFNNGSYIGILLGAQAVAFLVLNYERLFFPAMMLAFLWAGTDLPFAGVGTVGRWVLLIVGAFVGVVKWSQREHRRPLGAIHLTAGLCILATAVSSLVSSRVQTSLLKSLSLFLLFVYATAGVRTAVAGREAAFFRGLLRACEAVTYLSALCYFGAGFEVFGNPNSLGAIVGVAIIPVLLWGVLVAREDKERHRFTVALVLAVALLFFSVARASIVAAGVAGSLMCLCLRRGKLLVQGSFVLLLILATVAVLQPERFVGLVDSFAFDVIYKGKPETDLLGSRQGPWQETTEVIQQSPWFGSGFGTDEVTGRVAAPDSLFRSSSDTSREHGSSYLTLLQYLGLLGSVPFLAVLSIILFYIRRVCARMWRSGDAGDYAIPLAFICLSGLINAGFEDWMVSVGYYLNVFFWTAAFLLADFQKSGMPPQSAQEPLRQPSFVPVSR